VPSGPGAGALSPFCRSCISRRRCPRIRRRGRTRPSCLTSPMALRRHPTGGAHPYRDATVPVTAITSVTTSAGAFAGGKTSSRRLPGWVCRYHRNPRHHPLSAGTRHHRWRSERDPNATRRRESFSALSSDTPLRRRPNRARPQCHRRNASRRRCAALSIRQPSSELSAFASTNQACATSALSISLVATTSPFGLITRYVAILRIATSGRFNQAVSTRRRVCENTARSQARRGGVLCPGLSGLASPPPRR
jgi:hypothetical protein